MKRVFLLILFCLSLFSVFSQNVVEDFKRDIDSALKGISDKEWKFSLRILDNGIYSYLRIALPEDIPTDTAQELSSRISDITDLYFSGLDIQTTIGRELYYREYIEPIDRDELFGSEGEYFDLERFLIRNQYISFDEREMFSSTATWSYYIENPSSDIVIGVDRRLLIDAVYFNLEEIEEIKNLLESKLNIKWLE